MMHVLIPVGHWSGALKSMHDACAASSKMVEGRSHLLVAGQMRNRIEGWCRIPSRRGLDLSRGLRSFADLRRHSLVVCLCLDVVTAGTTLVSFTVVATMFVSRI